MLRMPWSASWSSAFLIMLRITWNTLTLCTLEHASHAIECALIPSVSDYASHNIKYCNPLHSCACFACHGVRLMQALPFPCPSIHIWAAPNIECLGSLCNHIQAAPGIECKLTPFLPEHSYLGSAQHWMLGTLCKIEVSTKPTLASKNKKKEVST